MWYCDTAHPVALESNDHIHPLGTANDNSANPKFNAFMRDLLGERLSVLDIGCAGGAMVESFVRQGVPAVGIEGSDYSQERKRASWGSVPDNLFTADATKPFTIHLGDREPFRFTVITAWEFFEHIKREDLPGVMDNIVRHAAPSCWLICSISTGRTLRSGVLYHQTSAPESFWVKLFTDHGFSAARQDEMRDKLAGKWVRNAGDVKVAVRYGVR